MAFKDTCWENRSGFETFQVRGRYKVTQRSLKGRTCSRGFTSRAPISSQNFKGKHRKKPLSCKISERKLRIEIREKETIEGERKTQDFSKLFQLRVCWWFTILFWVLPKKLYASKTPWLTGLCGCLELVWENFVMGARHLVMTTLAHAQTFDRCV